MKEAAEMKLVATEECKEDKKHKCYTAMRIKGEFKMKLAEEFCAEVAFMKLLSIDLEEQFE